MIVVDASAFTDASASQGPVADRMVKALGSETHWLVPPHFHIEAANAMRGKWLRRDLTDDEFAIALQRLADVEVDICPAPPLLPRMRELAAHTTAYDAAYVALAEDLACPLLTSDAKIARIPGIRCRVIGPTE